MEQRVCKVSGRSFTVTDEDIAMYAKFGVPLPTLCPEERMRRRMAWRNERILFYRPSSLSGDLQDTEILSMYRPNTPFPVYPAEYWFTDKWTAPSLEFDFNRPFYDQFKELQNMVPRAALFVTQSTMTNSKYNNCAGYLKNCYMCFASDGNEDCYYGVFYKKSRSCVDNVASIGNELCYDTVNCSDCYNLKYSEDCKNSRDSWFLSNCIGCSDCLLCTNLRRSQYCILNQQYSKEEYFRKISELNFGKWSTIEMLRAKFLELYKQSPHPASFGTQNEGSLGNAINHTKNAYQCFESFNLEDCRYCTRIGDAKDCMDFTCWGNLGCELMYECCSCGDRSYNCQFTVHSWENCRDLEYCDHCFASSDCFGCVGLFKRQYCIFNRQYTKGEYESLKERIKGKMREEGIYGEFFPMAMSAIPYHDSIAQDYYPLDESSAQALGANWDQPKTVATFPVTYPIPDDIVDVRDDILDHTLVCAKSGKAFKLIKQELEYYRTHQIPVPQLCFDERHLRRLSRTLPRTMFNSTCAKTGKPIMTPFDPAQGLTVWDREEFDRAFA